MSLPVKQMLYTQSVVNPIGGMVSSAPTVGYLDENKSLLKIKSIITHEDATNYFKFDFRKGKEMNMSVAADKGVRVQLMDGSGTRILADSSGSKRSLNDVFAKLKGEGVKMKNGTYVLKVMYDTAAPKSKNLNYEITLSSGTRAENVYETKAYATTVMQTLNAGGSIGGYSGLVKTTEMLSGLADDTVTPNIIDYMA